MVQVRHNFQSAVSDKDTSGIIKPTHWNDNHALTLPPQRLVGRDTSGVGPAEDIEVGNGLEFNGSQKVQLTDTGVTPGLYTNARVTVDAKGRITNAQSGPADGVGAPASPEYFVGTADAQLPQARVPTDTDTIAWDVSTANQFKANVITAALNAADLLTLLKTVDGSGSGLDADKLDNRDSLEFALYSVLASNANALGASLIGIEDAGSYFTGADVEAALQYLGGAVAALDQAVILKGTWDASGGSFPGSGAAQAGWSYIVSVGGTVGGVAFVAGDRIIAIVDNASTSTYASNWFKADYTDQVSSVAGRTGAVTLAQADISGLTTADSPSFAGVLLNQDGLTVKGGSANALTIKPNETLSAARTLNLVTGDATRTITLSGNPTLADWFNQSVKTTSTPTFGQTTILTATAYSSLIVKCTDAANATGLLIQNSDNSGDFFLFSFGPSHSSNGQAALGTSKNRSFFFYSNNTSRVGLLNTGEWVPSANDGTPLGASGQAWSDLFLASGGVINWNAGNATITHSSNKLTILGGLVLAASTTTVASLNIPQGSAPTSPVDGDVWRADNTNTGLKVRINGVTKTITVS